MKNKILDTCFNFTEDIEEQVVGVILDLASPDSLDDYRTEAVAVGTSISLLKVNMNYWHINTSVLQIEPMEVNFSGVKCLTCCERHG